MNTQIKVFDFNLLKNKQKTKKSDSVEEKRESYINNSLFISDIYANYATLTGGTEDFKLENAFTVPRDSYFFPILEVMDYAISLGKYIKHKVPINVLEHGRKFEITYTTHNEPKEFIFYSYIGKETGNIYYSNQGEDIIIGNISDYTDIPFTKIINIFQKLKLEGDIEVLRGLVIDNEGVKHDNPYQVIFGNSKTNTLTKDKNSGNDREFFKNMMDIIKALIGLKLYANSITYMVKFAQYCMSYNIGRVSKVSDDMYDLIADFSLINYNYDTVTSIDSLEEDYSNLFFPDIDRITSRYYRNDIQTYKKNFLLANTEYAQYTKQRMKFHYDENPFEDIKMLTQLSLIDNMSGEHSIYSTETKKEIQNVYNVTINPSYLALGHEGVNSALENINAELIRNDLSATDVLLNVNKVVYKYIQRLHKVLEAV